MAGHVAGREWTCSRRKVMDQDRNRITVVSGIARVGATGETGETWNMFVSEPMSILSVLFGSGRGSGLSGTTTMSSC